MTIPYKEVNNLYNTYNLELSDNTVIDNTQYVSIIPGTTLYGQAIHDIIYIILLIKIVEI